MRGLMQDRPLALNHIFHRAERLFADRSIVVAGPEGDVTTAVGQWADSVRRLAGAFDELGLSADARVGTFAVNHLEHLTAYYAAPLTGRIVHTINIRLSASHLRQIVNGAQDEAIIVDSNLLAAIWPLADQLQSVRWWIVVDDGSGAEVPQDDRILDFNGLLSRTPPRSGRFEIADENLAAGLCYTSGTTGDPRGVLYSHRSTVLHAMMLMTAGNLGIHEADVVMPIVPMFHADAWGLPYAALFAGATLALPGRRTAPAELAAFAARNGVTVAAAATTVWNMLVPHFEALPAPGLKLRMAMTGASAPSDALFANIKRSTGVPLTNSWGMTEISPMAVLGGLSPEHNSASEDVKDAVRRFQGRPVPFVELRLMGPDGEQPWDGVSQGEVEVSGPWAAAAYAGVDAPSAFSTDGWLRTGDLGTINPRGYLRIVDRIKDVIKSGGEWISSVQLENAIMSHPAVAEAAVIGRPDEKWSERPVAAVVLRKGEAADREAIIEHLRPLVAKWWLPDDIYFLDELPKTATGKFSKVELRKSLL